MMRRVEFLSRATYRSMERRLQMFLVLGVVSGVLSTLPPLCVGAGFVYGGCVLVPWGLLQRLPRRTLIATVVASGIGYTIAAMSVLVGLELQQIDLMLESPPISAVGFRWLSGAGLVGLGVALLPLLITVRREVVPVLLGTSVVAAVVVPLLFLAIMRVVEEAYDLLVLHVLWSALTALTLMLASPAEPDPHRCTTCNYDLHGNTTGQCPECGAPVSSD